tara:strand:+ start:43 stop:483 length:441 start_codon:yes stop_codon:yes gene_type:complete
MGRKRLYDKGYKKTFDDGSEVEILKRLKEGSEVFIEYEYKEEIYRTSYHRFIDIIRNNSYHLLSKRVRDRNINSSILLTKGGSKRLFKTVDEAADAINCSRSSIVNTYLGRFKKIYGWRVERLTDEQYEYLKEIDDWYRPLFEEGE